MIYESIIREVFKCGRGQRFGADADIFRGLERLSSEKASKPYEYGIKTGAVIAYLRTALYEIQDKHKNNEAFCSKIDHCLEYLRQPSMGNIDKCLNEAADALEDVHIIVTRDV